MNTEIGSLPKSTVKAYRALHSCKFTKDMLNTVKVSSDLMISFKYTGDSK